MEIWKSTTRSQPNSKITPRKKPKCIKNNKSIPNNEAPLLLIDSSYSCFYRAYALQIWYGLAHKEEMLEIKENDNYDWTTNEVFMNKYEKMFLQGFNKIIKKYKVPYENIVFAIDCPRDQIWRMKFYNNYKSNRDSEKHKKASIKEIFKLTYNNILPQLVKEKGINTIRVDKAEADDIIAVIKNEIRRLQPERLILIITGDLDYLQLIDDKTIITNLKGTNLKEKSKGNAKDDLLYKILLGDNSDYIPSCFDRCGPKTVQKYIEDNDLLTKKLDNCEKSKKQFELNRLLIDFDYIPKDIKESICKKALESNIIPKNTVIQTNMSNFINS